MRLKDNVSLITGAAQGLGLAYAERFAAEGATLALADIDGELMEKTGRRLSQAGAKVTWYQTNVSSVEDTERLSQAVLSDHGRIDVLINNAAIFRGIRHDDTTNEYLEKVMQVNLWGVWRMSRAVVPTMIEQGAGVIINQGSDAAYAFTTHPMKTNQLPNFSYGWSKWGVHGLTKFMAGHLAPHSVRVNCISPGFILTEATKEVVGEERLQQTIESVVPMRTGLRPADVAGTAVFLASDDARYITGQIICVDGGLMMPA
jgi:3-oxoacyl-[acyl-carrier protein] reductase